MALFLGQSQTLDDLDVFLQTYSSKGFSGFSKAPRQKQQWWGMGSEDTEWLLRHCLLQLPPQVLEGRLLQSGMGMGGSGSKLGILKAQGHSSFCFFFSSVLPFFLTWGPIM